MITHKEQPCLSPVALSEYTGVGKPPVRRIGNRGTGHEETNR